MATRFTIYCKQTVANVTPEELLAGTCIADLHTIAEGYGISDDEVILDALDQLRIENVDPSGFLFYRLSYRPDGMRQIDIHRWQTRGEVESVVAEVLADLTTTQHPELSRIQAHLSQTVDIVSASFGSSASEQMAPALARKSHAGSLRTTTESFVLQIIHGGNWARSTTNIGRCNCVDNECRTSRST